MELFVTSLPLSLVSMTKLLKYQFGVFILLASLFSFASFDTIDQDSANPKSQLDINFVDEGHNSWHHVDNPHHQITFDETLDEKEDKDDRESSCLRGSASLISGSCDFRALLLSYTVKRYYPTLSTAFVAFDKRYRRLSNFRL